MVATPRELGMAALGGALGVFAGAVLRLRMLATAVALAGCALVAAVLPGSSSQAVPYVARAVRYAVRTVPGTTSAIVLSVGLTLPLLVVVLSGLVAVRRRRVV
jgi:hypothetical protein